MRILVFFDLPITTLENRKAYSKFRKFLIQNGFMMLQESVYCKLALNAVAAGAVISNVKLNIPKEGLVELLTVTERQFSRMEILIGEAHNEVLNSDERLVFL
ncbi:MAG: CRISPR-associated endonuclease Cas2 [Phascolarctobacterium sp.]|nr:CRISPR-associated endonuclease Cas2 [Phascolarctobacterium sp.]MDO4920882.1 CRISPR-associated endonuclease Cas2 [Phascolarctobacterium sp.]